MPTEHLHEKIQEEAMEGKGKWSLYVALSTAIMAVLAAVAGLMAGHHADEALIKQIKSSDQWAFYQAKSIKAEIVNSNSKMVATLSGKAVESGDAQRTERYEKEKEEIKGKAEAFEMESEFHMDKHMILARAVTLFQIAIAISAISIITKKRFLWVIGLLICIGGCFFLTQGILF